MPRRKKERKEPKEVKTIVKGKKNVVQTVVVKVGETKKARRRRRRAPPKESAGGVIRDFQTQPSVQQVVQPAFIPYQFQAQTAAPIIPIAKPETKAMETQTAAIEPTFVFEPTMVQDMGTQTKPKVAKAMETQTDIPEAFRPVEVAEFVPRMEEKKKTTIRVQRTAKTDDDEPFVAAGPTIQEQFGEKFLSRAARIANQSTNYVNSQIDEAEMKAEMEGKKLTREEKKEIRARAKREWEELQKKEGTPSDFIPLESTVAKYAPLIGSPSDVFNPIARHPMSVVSFAPPAQVEQKEKEVVIMPANY